MGSIISYIDEKIEEHGSLEDYKKVIHTPHWDERNAPVCERHNYRGYLCRGCYEEKIAGIAGLLADCLHALNQIPNKRIEGKYKDTYSLCSEISKALKEKSDER